MRLENKVAVVTGAGQTAGITVGNGRATALLFARHGAKLMLVDRDDASVKETAELIKSEGGECLIHAMDVTDARACLEMIKICQAQFGRIDILHNNVGIGAGDRGVTHLTEESWDRIMDVNLKSMFLTAKYAIPVMREQQAGVVINISSVAAIAASSMLAYKTSKAGVIALTQQIAGANARYGIRANCILPGLMNTPMAVEGYSQLRGVPREQVVSERDARVPLGSKMGTAWDVAHAALFLASDEAGFITGVNLPVDGGQSIRIG
ncbi:MAG: SDR family oxidoreductase [Gammaproteobacteria bacterium]|nr:SDR family oxidoreductase [Gammaproteobacteria bacterium]MBT5203798.1 SDR family oxidoreductase [Gammaproteobacteria bacterium]MBT5603164.1 SDR family oxidoreductase [Gammaproteobacteria bacterium]MBT6246223.1 SDR family oxidoreductase [Gammaproteobacteria bacterium]